MLRRRLVPALAVLLVAATARGQELTQRGFLEARGTAYPQATASDATRLVGDLLFRDEASWRPAPWLTLTGGFDARADSHDRVERRWSVDWRDRGARRPALSVRRASVALRHGGFSLEAGKQFVRWGKADILNPTDRFAPRDYLDVVDNDFLPVTALRATWERKQDTVDAIWQPTLTPSRIPLFRQRWAVLPAAAGTQALGAASLVDLGPRYPTRSQYGLRWNHVASRIEVSLSAYDGFNHLPRFDVQSIVLPAAGTPAATTPRAAVPAIAFRRVYPAMRMFGGDVAVPSRWVTLKAEGGYFQSRDRGVDEYAIYVVQVERQAGEWFFAGGYAGEVVTRHRQAFVFEPDRGLANTFLGRASYTIDVNRSVAFEGAVRRGGEGAWGKAEYSQAAGQHLRATARVNVIRGKTTDFLGRYRRNSNLELLMRYSF